MKLGDILAELREDRGLTQLALSEQLHISNSSISAYETGSRLPNIEALLAFSDFYDVTVDYLLGRTTDSVSPSVLKQEYVEGVSMASLIKKLLSLDPEHRSAISLVIEDARFFTDVRRKTTPEGNDQL